MCLIIYSPTCQVPVRKVFSEAAQNNPDGIGVMSADGVRKFVGKRKARRAYGYIQALARDAIPYAVHFRWATHGRVSRENTHPFEIPGTGRWLMHNGVLWTATLASEAVSDTRIFADQIAPDLLQRNPKGWQREMADEAAGNRLLVMSEDGSQFDIINKALWTKAGGLWYSNQYSCDIPGVRTPGVTWIDSSRGYLPARYDSRGVAGPSGPTLNWTPTGYRADEDTESGWQYSDSDDDEALVERAGLWDDWDSEYKARLAEGYDYDEAEELANIAVARLAREAASPRASVPPVKSGFDWHDSATWTRYPIPGTEARAKVAAKHDIDIDPVSGIITPGIKYT